LNVIKHKFIAARGKGGVGKVVAINKALAHVRYIQHRPGEDREQGGREMFNDSEDRLNAREMRQAIKDLGNSKVIAHKLILSPEVTPEDKIGYTREVMKNLSRHKGSDLEWFAVAHDNTDHHHIHVVVLGKDRNGIEVNLSLKDIEQAREYSDRYIERRYPREFERAREARALKERERQESRKQERGERIRDGLELPWMKKNVIREQLEPYHEWKKKQDRQGKEKAPEREQPERPYHNDTIEAAGREWSRAATLEELRTLNEHLWDNYEDRIPVDEYKKLTGWIRDKERAKVRDDKRQAKGKDSENQPEKDFFEHKGKTYKREDSYEKLSGLARQLREEKERLPFDEYQQLRGWIENADRARFSGVIDKQIEQTHKKFERSKTAEDLKAAEGGRVLNPLQEKLMSNPAMGLYMQFASMANELVISIPLDDRNRDYLKEGRDGLEDAKKTIDEKERKRKGLNPIDLFRIRSQEERDREAREKIEKAIEQNKEAKERERKEKKRKSEDRERGEDWDRFDPWGRY